MNFLFVYSFLFLIKLKSLENKVSILDLYSFILFFFIRLIYSALSFLNQDLYVLLILNESGKVKFSYRGFIFL